MVPDRNRPVYDPGRRHNDGPSTPEVEGAEHVVVAGGGVVVADERVRDAHGAAVDVDAAAHALAVGGAVPAVGFVVADGGIHNARGGVLEVQAAAQAVAAEDAGAPRGQVAADGRVRDGDER